MVDLKPGPVLSRKATFHSMGAIPWWLPQQGGGLEQEEVSGVRDMD
ncbi:hypothetical protein [Siphonobacter sp. BAB-5405]|nr:hypothetical protein [Siphonobacter sp. BAB-5405]